MLYGVVASDSYHSVGLQHSIHTVQSVYTVLYRGN